MDIITQNELKLRYKEIMQKIKEGAVFIAPTDTIYGLHCNALLEKSVAKIRQLKQRPDTPFSVWAPSVAWIKKNCIINKEAQEELKKLPGPYTLVLPLRKNKFIAKNVTPSEKTLGVRLPKHWFHQMIEKLEIPLVTTSTNRTAQPFMTSLENLDREIAVQVEFIIYEGPKEARPSTIVNLMTKKIKER